MNEKIQMSHTQLGDHNAEEQFVKALKRHTKLLKAIIRHNGKNSFMVLMVLETA